MTVRILIGHVLDRLRELPPESVHCVVTSPPYFGLRDYGIEPQIWGGELDCEHAWQDASWRAERWGAHDDDAPGPKQRTNGGSLRHRGQVHDQALCARCGAWRGSLGLEPTPALYVEHIVEVFREVRRVLRSDGTLWLNLGDSYAGSWGAQGRRVYDSDNSSWHGSQIKNHPKRARRTGSILQDGLKPKDLIGIPWRVAFALQADGWWLRQDIIWAKPNPMPESVQDRCTKAHEYLFLLSKNDRYHYDGDAVREASIGTEPGDIDGGPQRHPDGSNANLGRNYRRPNSPQSIDSPHGQGFTRRARGGVYIDRNSGNVPNESFSRNRRSVWSISTEPFPEAHFATFPTGLVEPCILAGCPKDGTALDPFSGAGTTGLVADRLRRDAILIELNPDYAEMARRRIQDDSPLFSDVAAD